MTEETTKCHKCKEDGDAENYEYGGRYCIKCAKILPLMGGDYYNSKEPFIKERLYLLYHAVEDKGLDWYKKGRDKIYDNMVLIDEEKAKVLRLKREKIAKKIENM